MVISLAIVLLFLYPVTSRSAAAVFIPTLNSNEIVVAITTPQQYGAVADGITDCTAAFQNAMNAVYNSGGPGGGTVYVPAGNYAFYTNLTIPTGVTLHGDWSDWTTSSAGAVGATFKVYFGDGQPTNTPFITMNSSSALKGVNLWYPNQNAANIISYPYSIQINNDCVIQNVALVNSYQGIVASQHGDHHILSTIVGTPLYKGMDIDGIYDVPQMEDIRFSPDIWPASLLTNAPAAGGPHAAWMRANGTGMRLVRIDGEVSMETHLSGYNVGILFTNTGNGDPGCTFYGGAITNCATGIMPQNMPGALGLLFANFTFDDDVAINRTRTSTDANVLYDHCTIIGRNGPAVSSTGLDWQSWMQFQDCVISNALQLNVGVFNTVNSVLLGSTQCVLSASATRAAFTGCTFGPTQKIVNSGNASNLIVDVRPAVSNAFPFVAWTNIVNDYLSRRPAKTNLFLTTSYGSTGNGVNDDTAAIQKALNAAGANGGGIVFLPAGKYHLTNTLDVPGGVQLRGTYEMRHGSASAADGKAKGSILRPYEGQGTTNGPPAIALEANAGLLGVTLSYETQNSNCIPFPPAIQGRGANIYAIGVNCPNPYYYVDLDTYTCTNHFIYMVDGWALKSFFNVGHGSSGTIVDNLGNWIYWIGQNGESASSLPKAGQPPVLEFVAHNSRIFTLGDCTELVMKTFSIEDGTFMRFIAENGRGPNATLISDYGDGCVQGMVLDAAAPCSIVDVNLPMSLNNLNNDPDLATSLVGILSTTNFQGTARFNNVILFINPYLDFNINGGDVTVTSAHSDTSASLGGAINGGVFHLVNYAASTTGNPVYNLAFGNSGGVAGKTNEFIGCFAYNGCIYNLQNPYNSLNAWNDFALSSYSVLNNSLPLINNVYPDGSGLFQYANALNFTATSLAGIALSNIVVTIDGAVATNLIFSGVSTFWNVTCPGLALNRTHTAVITITDNDGHTATLTIGNVTTGLAGFNTFSPNCYIWQAEDYDYTSNGVSGLFVDNPQTNAYSGLAAVQSIDAYSVPGNFGTNHTPYRPSGLNQETARGNPQPPALNNTGFTNFDLGNSAGGNWGNYTRHYPVGAYNIYLRAANGLASSSSGGAVYWVTSGLGTTSQTTTQIGAFGAIPPTGGWQNYTWVPLKNSQGQLAQVTNDGSVKTLRIVCGGGYNADYFAMVSTNTAFPTITLAPAVNNGNLILSFPTQAGFNYQLEYEDNLENNNWVPVGSAIPGNNATQSITNVIGDASRFYRTQIY